MRWTVSIPKPGSVPPAASGLDGEAPSIEAAAHALVAVARDFLRRRGHAPSSNSVHGHIDGRMLTIEGLLDPQVPDSDIIEQIIGAVAAAAREGQTDQPADHRNRGEAVSSPRSGDLSTQLTRIQRWARGTLRQDALFPEPAVDLATVERNWLTTFPADLITLFSTVGESVPTLIPGYDLLTASRSDQIRTLWLDLAADQRAQMPEFAIPFDSAVLSSEPAGSPSELFLPEFIPVADRGTTLLVDTRQGEYSGCVSEYSAEGASDGWLWPSIVAMFGELADSLETGATFLRYQPVVRDRTLTWERHANS